MAAQHGRELLLKVHDGSASFEDANFTTVGGFASNNIKIANTAIEITSKDSGGFKESLDGGGQRSFSTDAEGTFLSDATFALVHNHILNSTHPLCRVVVPGHGTYEGKFVIISLDMTGAQNDEVTYRMAFESSGTVTFMPEAA
jgi:TP901-1 family phage major tail protein